ncbi:MAG: hypothetical protein OEY77_00095 [Nitrospira sp.]|nr:hypothetical protein [Nitrospira sp.]
MKARTGGRTIEIPDELVVVKKTIHLDMPFIFTLRMQIPSGKNAVQITRNGHRYPNKRFKKWRDEAMSQVGNTPVFKGPVSMTVDYTPGDNIRRDVPGLLDALCHLIEKIGTVEDDAQVKCVQWTTYPIDARRPLCRIVIATLKGAERS